MTAGDRPPSAPEPSASAFGDLPLFVTTQTLLAAVAVYWILGTLLTSSLGQRAGLIYRTPISWPVAVIFAATWAGILGWLSYSITRLRGPGWQKWAFRRVTLPDAGWIVAGLVGVYVATPLIEYVQSTLFHVTFSGGAIGRLLMMSTLGLPTFLFIAVGIVLSPLVEEIAVRGLLLGALRRRYGLRVAVIGSSLVFAAYHREPTEFAILFVTGLIFAGVFLKTGTLWAPYLTHALVNAASFARYMFWIAHHPH